MPSDLLTYIIAIRTADSIENLKAQYKTIKDSDSRAKLLKDIRNLERFFNGT